MIVALPVGACRPGASGRGFAQVERAGGERIEFESDVEPCAIGRQLRLCVFAN